MPDYAKTIIYKLIYYDYSDLVYVGSTTNFTNWKQSHKESCLNLNSKKSNLKIYVNIRKNGGWDNWNMIKICDYPCNNKRDAELEEDKYMMELKANMNSQRPSRTKKQYYEDNKNTIQQYSKQYRDYNKDYFKEYREDNKDILKVKSIQYYEHNKEKLKEKIKCECGCEVNKSSLTRHQSSKKTS
jgi:hypothetical protein